MHKTRVSDRQICVDCIQFFTDILPKEDDSLSLYCKDDLDLIEIVLECEKELCIHVDCDWIKFTQFTTVKDFIDFILSFKH